MTKFKIVKKMSLGFLGADWKDAYLSFYPVTISDIKNKFPEFSTFQGEEVKDPKKVGQSVDKVVSFLKDKFIEGKVIIMDGTLIPLKVEELEDLPTEVLSKALSFLSQGVTPAS
jgi:hypothetical protein